MKGGKPARPRFHVYFPHKKITAHEEVRRLKEAIQKELTFFDKGALDAARFIYGHPADDVVSPALTINRLVDGFDAVSEEASWPFRMPVQDGYYAEITPRPIGISYGSLNYYDMRAYLGCFRKIYSPGGALVVDTEDSLLFVRAITPIDEKGETYLIQTVTNTYDYSGEVYIYSKKEGVKPLEVPVADEEEDMWPNMLATNTRLRWMKNAAALKRR